MLQFVTSKFVPRTVESYDCHCSLLHGPLKEHHSTTYGINNKSVLNELEGFHVANSQLPQDMMHVLLEGVLPYELKLMLSEFINGGKKIQFTI